MNKISDAELMRRAAQTVCQTQYHVDVAKARHQNGIVARSEILKARTAKDIRGHHT